MTRLTQSGSNPSKLPLRESLSSSATSSPPIFVGVMVIAVAVVAVEPFDPIDLARKIFHRYHWYCWRPVVWISFVESPCTWRRHNIPSEYGQDRISDVGEQQDRAERADGHSGRGYSDRFP